MRRQPAGIGDTATNVTSAYCYDANNTELLSIKSNTCSGSPTQTFSYNGVGDRTQSVAGSVTTTQRFNQEHEPANFAKTAAPYIPMRRGGEGER